MVKHIILWQLKDEITGERKAQVIKEAKEGLESLPGKVPGLLELHVITEPLASSNADLMLDSTLTDAAALAGYAVHPEHVAVAGTKVAPFMKLRVCMDYEA